MAITVITVSCPSGRITTSALTIMSLTTIGTFMPWWEVAMGGVWMVGQQVLVTINYHLTEISMD